MAMYYNGRKVRNLYYNGKCITRLALGKELTRLVEGDDFVRAEWLVGDGTAYIDTNIIVDVPSLVIGTTITKPNISDANQGVFGSRDNINYEGSHIFYLTDGRFRIDILSAYVPSVMYVTLSDINTITIDVPNRNLIHNGVSYAATATNFRNKNSTHTFKIFSIDVLNLQGDADRPYSGSLSTFTLADGTHSLNLIPVRLLRPIPASLDGNGIARNAGECGMYDSISGKFFGNVASSGKFTVSDN